MLLLSDENNHSYQARLFCKDRCVHGQRLKTAKGIQALSTQTTQYRTHISTSPTHAEAHIYTVPEGSLSTQACTALHNLDTGILYKTCLNCTTPISVGLQRTQNFGFSTGWVLLGCSPAALSAAMIHEHPTSRPSLACYWQCTVVVVLSLGVESTSCKSERSTMVVPSLYFCSCTQM